LRYSPAKRNLIQPLGADAARDYLRPDWPEAVKLANGGKAVDIILAMTGGATFTAASHAMFRW
jgi:NADPH:quinone reductase-like Zn-dependent oxidoreductase